MQHGIVTAKILLRGQSCFWCSSYRMLWKWQRSQLDTYDFFVGIVYVSKWVSLWIERTLRANARSWYSGPIKCGDYPALPMYFISPSGCWFSNSSCSAPSPLPSIPNTTTTVPHPPSFACAWLCSEVVLDRLYSVCYRWIPRNCCLNLFPAENCHLRMNSCLCEEPPWLEKSFNRKRKDLTIEKLAVTHSLVLFSVISSVHACNIFILIEPSLFLTFG